MSSASRIEYSEKYADTANEYRHVILPKDLAKTLPKNRLLSESEWRGIGVQQSRGWMHYAIHRWAYCVSLLTFCDSGSLSSNVLISWFFVTGNDRPEPHILLFRRPLGTDPQSGQVDPELEREAREEYKNQFGILRK